jgi:magnesium transporter
MMPGPLLSPLSGGLSVVVADTLRRGIESPVRSRAIKRARAGLRKSKSRSSRGGDESESLLGTSPRDRDRDDDDDNVATPTAQSLQGDGGASWSGLTRARSLSNTLGDLFRSKRHNNEHTDEEAGPSGL